MREYTAFGKGHRMLARLEEGQASSAELRRIAAPTASSKKRDRLWRVVWALHEDGLIHRDIAAFYGLTQAGIDALACLRGGNPVLVDHPMRSSLYEVAA